MMRRILTTLALLALTFAAQGLTAAAAHDGHHAAAGKGSAAYACPMHPEVKSGKKGRCPKCKMDLTPVSPEAPKPPPQAATPAEKKTEALAQALRIPDITVYDQDGRKLNFYADLVRGKTVAVNFIFTTCTTICPPLAATMRGVQRELGERAGRDVELISVSVDPTTDTPARLKGFADKFKAGPGWTFVTGSKVEIDRLLVALGAYAGDKVNHTPMVLVGNDAAGSWTRTYGLASPSSLVKLIDEAAARQPAAAAGAAVVNAAGEAPKSEGESAASRYFPNTVLVTQEGRPVRFYDDLLKGRIVLINFMFTTCAGVCSPMTANLAKVQRYLGEHVGREVEMISISVDPATDTPEVLRKYAASFKAQPGWDFLTGKKEDVEAVLAKVGGYTDDKSKHSAVLLVGDVPAGKWKKLLAMGNAAEIASAVKEMIAAREKPAAGEKSADAAQSTR